jgi:hypothetical protein
MAFTGISVIAVTNVVLGANLGFQACQSTS